MDDKDIYWIETLRQTKSFYEDQVEDLAEALMSAMEEIEEWERLARYTIDGGYW